MVMVVVVGEGEGGAPAWRPVEAKA